MCVSVLSGTSQTDRPSSNRHPSLPGRWASVSLSVSFSHTRASASSFTSPCARYVYVPSLCANESVADLTRKKTHTRTHILTGGREGTRRGEGEEEVASPSLSSLSPTLLLLSFGSIRSSVLSVLCRSMCCCSVSASTLLLSSLSLRSILFLPHRIALFLSHPSSLSPRLVPVSKCLDGGLSAPVTAQGVRWAKVGSE